MTSLQASGIAIAGRLEPTDLRLAGGTMTAVIGPNGGGKTSLLRALAVVEPTARGLVTIDGEDVRDTPPARRPALLGFLPANREVPWSIGVRDTIALGLARPDPDRIEDLLALLELEPLAKRPIDRLSTGERARVLLARALSSRPRVLLLDEPCSNLDPYWAHRILEILAETAAEGTAVCLSLHDLGLLESCDRALLVDSGRILEDGSPNDVLATPAFLRSFRVARQGAGWRIIPSVDPRSSR